MKNIWTLILLFAFAGCQPEVQESPVAPPVAVSESEMQSVAIQAPAQPQTNTEPTKQQVAPSPVKPAQIKATPEIQTSKPEVIVAPAPVPEPAKPETVTKVKVAPVALPAPKAMFSESEAMALAKKKNCLACHALDKKVVGPAWRAVADKYRNEAGAQTILEAKVRKGGKGNWGSMAMPSQPALSSEELTELVTFVLQLK